MPENASLHPHERCTCAHDEAAVPSEIVLEVKNLTKKFTVDGGKMLTACDNVSLHAYRGQTLGIIGESGCGKSTLVRTILQIHPATAGEVIFEGQDILMLKGEALRQNRRKIQMVFQDPSAAFNPKMRVKDILCEPLLNFGLLKNSEIDAKAAELLQMVELPAEFKDRYPHSMSGGQRQRLGIPVHFRWNRGSLLVMKLLLLWMCPYRKKSVSCWCVCRRKKVLRIFLSATTSDW